MKGGLFHGLQTNSETLVITNDGRAAFCRIVDLARLARTHLLERGTTKFTPL